MVFNLILTIFDGYCKRKKLFKIEKKSFRRYLLKKASYGQSDAWKKNYDIFLSSKKNFKEIRPKVLEISHFTLVLFFRPHGTGYCNKLSC